MELSKETKVKEIALSYPGARQILEDAGVDYCCGGGESLHEACLHAEVPAEEILKRLRENKAQAGPDERVWISSSLRDLTGHIRERHHRYVREAIPRLRAQLAKVRGKHGVRHREIEEIEKLFGDVGREMIAHMQKEEQILFPYIEALERSQDENTAPPSSCFGSVESPIRQLIDEHEGAAALLSEMRKCTNGFTPWQGACPTSAGLYYGLAEFERDLHRHVHLENNLLFPRAAAMEKAMLAAK